LGYMGLPLAALIAGGGKYRVVGVDINAQRVEDVNSGKTPFEEKGLTDLLKFAVTHGGLVCKTQPETADVYIIAVPTPHVNKKCDMTYVLKAAEDVGKVAKDGQIVVVESTMGPGGTRQVAEKLTHVNLHIANCTERALPGNTIHELIHSYRMIGTASLLTFAAIQDVYKSFAKGDIFHTDEKIGECVKLAENAYRDVNIAFANDLAHILVELGISDVDQVIALANHHPRVKILQPGSGVGGHCIPIDPLFLTETTKAGNLLRTARAVNDEAPRYLARKVDAWAKKNNATKIGLLGVAYKPNVDDKRETPANEVLEELHHLGKYDVKYHDPFIAQWLAQKLDTIEEMEAWADVLVIVTPHDAFKGKRLSKPTFNGIGELV